MTKIPRSLEVILSEYVSTSWSYGLLSATVRGETWGWAELWFYSVGHSDKHYIREKKKNKEAKLPVCKTSGSST